MKSIKIDLENYTKKDIELIAREILVGKVVVLPTDTIYGLSAIVTNKQAIKKIYRIKKRISKQQKHLILLVKSFCMVRRYCYLSKKQYAYLKGQWMEGKRALTVILRGKREYFQKQNIDLFELISDDDGVAVRRPNDKFMLELLRVIDEPIVSTSLNITKQDDLKDISLIDNYFKKEKPDMVINAGKLPKRRASKIVNLLDMNKIKIIRK